MNRHCGQDDQEERMTLDISRDLFLYELATMRDAERRGGLMLGMLVGKRVQNSDLEHVLRAHEQDSKRQLENIDFCLQALDASPLETRSAAVEGMRGGFEEFLRLQPSPEVQDLFAIDTAMRFVQLAIGSYKSLVNWAVLMGESRCTQSLLANLVEKEESAGKLERIGHEMGERLLIAA
jgi:ferritin-like metal-binding protein YciE